jgi:hypothetical protein
MYDRTHMGAEHFRWRFGAAIVVGISMNSDNHTNTQTYNNPHLSMGTIRTSEFLNVEAEHEDEAFQARLGL